MSTNAQRLAQAVRARRQELDLSQLDVWQAGGPSNTTLTEIENGRMTTLTRTTAKRLDVGLDWEPGSAKRVWEGSGSATSADAASTEVAELRRRIEAAPIPDEIKARMLADLDTLTAEGVTEHGSSAAM